MIPVYLSICNKLAEKSANMAHIDLYNNQVETATTEHPYNLPACLIQFMPVTDWTTNADGSQTGTLRIQFHLVTTCYSDTANPHRFDEIQKQMAFKHLNFINEVHAILQNFSPECCTELKRTAYFPDTDYDQIHVTIIEYSCNFTDNSTADSIINATEIVEPDLVVKHPIDRPEEETATYPTPEIFMI